MRWSVTPPLLAWMLIASFKGAEALVPRPRVLYAPGSLLNRFELSNADQNIITKNSEEACCESGVLWIKPKSVSLEDGTEFYKGLIIKARRRTRKQRYEYASKVGGMGKGLGENHQLIGGRIEENHQASTTNLNEIKSAAIRSEREINGNGGNRFEVNTKGELRKNREFKSRFGKVFGSLLEGTVLGELQVSTQRIAHGFPPILLDSNHGDFKGS